jgi:twitching motility protein PilT
MSGLDYTLDDLLRYSVTNLASDLHLKAHSPPRVRIHGDLGPIEGLAPLTPEQARDLAYQPLSPEQIRRLEEDLELDWAYAFQDIARFRVNHMHDRGTLASVYRTIPTRISTMQELGLPELCKRVSDLPRGLVLVTGPTGSGKSTTLAAMLNYINEARPCHIMTVEDPLEFLHPDKTALVNQRELGNDTKSFANALKFVLRQDPDVILIGEMRDLETIGLAITAAETGHLVFATLHTTDAVQTVDRIVDVFPHYQQQQVRMQLSVNLQGVISQTLVKTADGQGRIAAFETMDAIPSVRNLVREAKTHQIGSIIQTGAKRGMWTLDQSLARLVQRGIVTFEDAYAKAGNAAAFEEMARSGEEAVPDQKAKVGYDSERAL